MNTHADEQQKPLRAQGSEHHLTAGSDLRTNPMKDYQAALEKLRRDAAEAALIRDLATDAAKREIFNRVCEHLNLLADEVERAAAQRKAT